MVSAVTAQSTTTPTGAKKHTVPIWTLVGIIIGSTIGSGIFALPQNIASVAGPGAMFIGWLIAGVGMLSVAFVFHILAHRKPHLDSGVYAYVRAGLGDYIGYTSGYGYWLGSVIAQVGYATLFFSTVGHYVPWLGSEHHWTQAAAVSVLTWVIFAILAKGIKQAKIMNAITTVAKLVPIVAFIVLVAFLGFSFDTFSLDFWGRASGASVLEQVQGIMLFTVWVFIGIEGASVYSKQAQTRSDVGRATVFGFITVLLLLVTVATLSFGVLTQEQLADLPDNSMGAVLEAVVGPWGGGLISIGLCLSVLGAYVSWQMLCAEPLAMMAFDGLLPRKIGAINTAGAPWLAQLISTIVIQVCVIIFYANKTAYASMVQLATVMYLLPYMFSSLYLVLLATRGRGFNAAELVDAHSTPPMGKTENIRNLITGAVAFGYSVWLIYAADTKYVLLGSLAILPGLIPYVWYRLRNNERVFNAFEWVVVVLIAVTGAVALWQLVNGTLTLYTPM